MKVLVKGIEFDKISVEKAAGRVLELAKSNTGAYVVTPNTEILARAADKDFSAVLSGADLVLCDGVGVSAMALFKGRCLPRVTGMGLAEILLKKAADHKIPVFLYGAKEGVAKRARKKLEERYQGLVIEGVCNGYEREDVATELIRQSKARIVFVCTSSPKQEFFAKKAIESGINAVFLAFGGALDVLSGDKRRAPRIFRILGLEWAYRFAKEPFRVKRFVKTVASSHKKPKIYK